MGNKYILIGGAGFIGFHLASALSEREVEVVIVDNFSNSKDDSQMQHLAQKRNVSVYKEGSASNNWKHHIPQSIIINLAARNGTNKFYSEPFDVLMDSSEPSLSVPRDAALLGAHSYYYLGSSESYAGSIHLDIAPIPTPENIPLAISDISNPRWSYACAKILGEVATFSARAQFDLPSCVFRIHNVYGPRMGFDHVVPDLYRKFRNGTFEIANCSHTRSFLFIDDAIALLLFLLEAEVAKSNNPVINVGSSQEVKVFDLAKIILEVMELDHRLECIQDHRGSVSRRAPDISLLKEIVGVYSEIPLHEGVRKTYRYYQEYENI